MKVRWSVLCLAVVVAAPALRAAPDDDAPQSYVEYVEVDETALPESNTIAAKLALPLQMTPANVGTVGAPLIYEQDADLLSDALRNVSGLNIQNGSGVHDYFTIRGFDSVSSGLVMTDGAAEPEVTYYQMYNVEGVEVFKGPAGFLYGRNPLGGAVNIVRKQPLEGNFAVLGGSFGSFGTTDGSIDWNAGRPDGDFAFRLNGVWEESDGFRDSTESSHWAVNPSAVWNLEGGGRLGLNLEFVDAEYAPDGGIPLVNGALPDVRRRTSYQGSGDFSEQELTRFQIDYEEPINDRIMLRSKTYFRELDWNTDGTIFQGTFDLGGFGTQVVRDLARLDDRQRFIGSQLEAVIRLGGGRVQHNLLVGIEVARETDEFTFEVRELQDTVIDFGAPFGDCGTTTGLPGLCQSPELASNGDVESVILAPYLIDQMQFSPRWELLLGARYDMIDTEGTIFPLIGPFVGVTSPVAFSRDDREVSPMLGAVFAPDETTSVYANASRSYAPASTRLVDELDPAGRRPEQGTQVEVGVKKRFMDDRLRTTFAVYEIDRERIAIADQFFFTQQSGDQRSRGFEFELAAEPRPRLRTFFSYAYNDSELTDFTPFDSTSGGFVDYTGKTPVMAPEHVANFWVSKSFSGGWGVAGGVRFVDEQFVAEDNLFTLDDALILDASAFYDYKQWRFKVNVKNLTDEEYETRGIAGGNSVIPARPFAAYASFEVRL